jgi:two-component system sensor histidine kinase ChiS
MAAQQAGGPHAARTIAPGAWHVATYLFLAGALLFAGVSNLNIFLMRRGERVSGYFGILCLVTAINVLLPNTSLLRYPAPWLTDALVLRLDLLTLSAMICFAALLTSGLFPLDTHSTIIKGLVAVSCLTTVVTLAAPRAVLPAVFRSFVFLAGMFSMYTMYIAVRATLLKRPDAMLTGVGIVFISIAGGTDVLTVLEVIDPLPLLLPVAMVGFTYVISYIVARRFTAAYAGSERLAAELKENNIALSRMDAVKDQFLANTSHELRTPLTGIVGIAESLPEAYPTMAQGIRGNLDLIAASGRRLALLVNDILDFSRLKNHDILLVRRPVHLAPLVSTIIRALDPLVKGKRVTLVVDIPADLPWVDADENRLQQILYNLAGNAVKFSDEGEVRIRARPAGNSVLITVTDCGPGIPAELHERIFEPFEMASGSEQKRAGTGLGLGIARHLVELHGGTMSLQSAPGEGSAFSFTIPRCSGGCEEPGAESTSRLTPVAGDVVLRQPHENESPVLVPDCTGGDATVRILAVDDEPVILQAAVNHLASAGYHVETCQSGREALARLDRTPRPDLVLLDLMMPGMSGYEACEHIRERCGQAELPVIIVTARNRLSDLVRGFSAGANDYLVKPYLRDELLARVRTHLKLREAFVALGENSRLKEEVRRRARREQHLRMVQRRLAETLNSVPVSVCAVDETGSVLYANRLACDLFKRDEKSVRECAIDSLMRPARADTAGGMPLSRRLTGIALKDRLDLEVRIDLPDGARSGLMRLQAMPLSLEDEDLAVLIVHDRRAPGASDRAAALFVEELNHNRQRLERLDRAFLCLDPKQAPAIDNLRSELRAIDTALDQITLKLKTPDAAVDRRDTARQIMTLAVAYWEERSGESKLELARESGLWRIEVSPDGHERTRTLDRYLDLRTFPKAPRWKKILATGDFVLSRCSSGDESRRRLEAAMSRLRLTC